HGGKIFARYWLHNGLLNLAGRKMSKSLGNVTLVHDLLDAHPPEALRYVLMSAHYRQPLDWSDAAVEQAIRTLDRLYGTLRDLADVDAGEPGEPPPAILAALCDDLNTPQALAQLAAIASEARRADDPATRRACKRALLDAGALLGLLQQAPEDWFKRNADDGDAGISAEQIDALVTERDAARKARDFARSDALREQLTQLGVLVEDGADGARWRWNR